MADRDDLILAANWYQTRAHYTLSMQPNAHQPGSWGKALCDTESSPVKVYDQSHHEVMAAKYSEHKPKPFEKLPLCKKCARRAQLMGLVDG